MKTTHLSGLCCCCERNESEAIRFFPFDDEQLNLMYFQESQKALHSALCYNPGFLFTDVLVLLHLHTENTPFTRCYFERFLLSLNHYFVFPIRISVATSTQAMAVTSTSCTQWTSSRSVESVGLSADGHTQCSHDFILIARS